MSRLRKSSWCDVLSFFHSEEEKVCEHDSLERIKRRIDHLLVLFQLRGQLNIILVISTYSSYIGRPQFLHSHKHHLHLNHSLDLCGHSALVSLQIALKQVTWWYWRMEWLSQCFFNAIHSATTTCLKEHTNMWFLFLSDFNPMGVLALFTLWIDIMCGWGWTVRGLLQKKMVLECFKKNNFFL